MAVRSFAASLPPLPTDDWLPPRAAPATPVPVLPEPHPWPVRRHRAASRSDRAEFVGGVIGGVVFVLLPGVLLLGHLVG